jgi:anti-sigma B factor antagonist
VLTISSRQVGIAIVVAVTGKVDLSTGPALRAALAEAVDRPGHGPVVVDLSAVTFLGSTGIAVLVDADWQARQRDRDLRLVIGPGNTAVIHPLAAAGIHGLLHTFDDVDSATR